jgi:hypothetical protein
MDGMNNNTSASGGIGFLGVLAAIFITLKLTGYIDWSWWMVLAPIWGPWAVIGAVGMIVMVLAIVGERRNGQAR